MKPGAALISREGDFGFSASNGNPEAGHDIEVVNFSRPNQPLRIQQSRFAWNTMGDEAYTDGIHGINRPTDLKYGRMAAPTWWTTGRSGVQPTAPIATPVAVNRSVPHVRGRTTT